MNLPCFAVLVVLAWASATQVNDLSAYFPSAKGLSWHYEVSKHSTISAGSRLRRSEKSGTATDQVVETVHESVVSIHRRVTETNESMGDVALESIVHVRVERSSVAIVAVGVVGSPSRIQTLAVPQPILRDTVPGPPIEGKQGSLILRTQLISQLPSRTEVPAGAFPDCLVTETKGDVSGTLNGLPVQSGTIEIRSWYARGVGLVREERNLHFIVQAPDKSHATVQEIATKVLKSHEGL